MSEQVSVYRLLKYTGSKEWIERTMRNGCVPPNGKIVIAEGKEIRSAIVNFDSPTGGEDAVVTINSQGN